ncbi:uncharacterized protein BCR38DRAFT_415541 [Pseudomassariella vexata]|uniref:Uncharacterized protein n=1 Tax=Pseudomassariella vexata TaxID=1141098 RepID=A0A1Y2EI74_9PEZI|nr:uncharacterized protein BCR38DRAFT_415541 [Pseudomassariella vexata]ORY70946.1 hypothetical protein BCR38DRAFT_415541 [Pseudomassariella vexata]
MSRTFGASTTRKRRSGVEPMSGGHSTLENLLIVANMFATGALASLIEKEWYTYRVERNYVLVTVVGMLMCVTSLVDFILSSSFQDTMFIWDLWLCIRMLLVRSYIKRHCRIGVDGVTGLGLLQCLSLWQRPENQSMRVDIHQRVRTMEITPVLSLERHPTSTLQPREFRPPTACSSAKHKRSLMG